MAADTAAIQRGGGVLLRKRLFLYRQCGRGLPRAGGSGWQSCERDYSCTDKVARGRATSRGGFRLRLLVCTLRTFRFAVGELRNSVRFANSITAFHFFALSPSFLSGLLILFPLRLVGGRRFFFLDGLDCLSGRSRILFRQKASDLMDVVRRSDVNQLRGFRSAAFGCVWAAGVEMAALRRVDRAGDVALQDDAASAFGRVDGGNG